MYACKVIEDSLGPSGCRMTTLAVTYPLGVHWDFIRHNLLSCSAGLDAGVDAFDVAHSVASNRAIPTNVYLGRVADEPAGPEFWGLNQPGMVASKEATGWRLVLGKTLWFLPRWVCLLSAWCLAKLGFHKEIVNWLVFPWTWVTQVVTATEWSNFDALRIHPAARAEMRKIAAMMRDARAASIPRKLKAGEWHLPYVSDLERSELSAEQACYVSSARVARVSTGKLGLRHGYGVELEKGRQHVRHGHFSVTDHQAEALPAAERVANFYGFRSFRSTIPNSHDYSRLKVTE